MQNGVEIDMVLRHGDETIDAAPARSACSPACTRPRWRSGSASVRFARHRAEDRNAESLRSRPATSARCRSLATRLRITPAIRTAGSCAAKPRTTAAADCDCPDTSSTSTTGKPKRAAISAVVPRCPVVPATPSNKPMTPSMTRISAPSAVCAASASSSAAAWPSCRDSRSAGRSPPHGRPDRCNRVPPWRPAPQCRAGVSAARMRERHRRLAGARTRRRDDEPARGHDRSLRTRVAVVTSRTPRD